MKPAALVTIGLVFLAGQVFAQSRVTFSLELGPYDPGYVAAWKARDYSASPPVLPILFQRGSPADDQVFPVDDVITWDLVVSVDPELYHQGTAGGPGVGYRVCGVANLVFNLQLEDNAGNLLTSFAAGSATARGFYSAINDGTGTDPLRASAFALSLNLYNFGPGRSIDPWCFWGYPAGGPRLDVYTYPTIVSGKLLGQGCGYGEWNPIGSHAVKTTPGVGVPYFWYKRSSDGQVVQYTSLAGIQALCEGQLNTVGMTPGSYVLRAVPGSGLNVLRGDVDLVNNSQYAFAVAANEALGDTIRFTLEGPPPTVGYFAINEDAATSASRTVSLNNVSQPFPTEYMASESAVFADATWRTHSTAPSFALSAGSGIKTVYFKVRNAMGESPPVSDTITFIPVGPDFDQDGDVDRDDYLAFEACASAPGVPLAAGCGGKDFDGDSDVDQSDFAVFQCSVTGPYAPRPTIFRSPATLTSSTPQGINAASQTFTVANGGFGALNYSIGDDASWLSVTPASGSSTGEADTITVDYTSSALAQGTYGATITVADANATNSPQTIAVTLTVGFWWPLAPPDFDHDGDVDLDDFALFQACVTGPGMPQYDPYCQNARLDGDLDVDQNDFAVFQQCMSGPGILANPACVN